MVLFLQAMLGLSRRQKQWVMVAVDALLCVVSVFVAFGLRVGAFQQPLEPRLIFLAVALPLFLPIFHLGGIYKSMLRFVGVRSIRDLAVATLAYTIILMVVFMLFGVPGIPRTVAILHPIIFLGCTATVRIVVRQMLTELGMSHGLNGAIKQAMIYGAGLEGQQLAMQLRHEPQFQLRGFFDDDAGLFNHKVDGLLIHPSSSLVEVLSGRNIDILFIAAPALSRQRNREIVEQLAELHVQVQILPPLREIVDGTVSISALREVKIDDLLGRDPVTPNANLLSKTIAGKCVLVTGAGGSIGSELCRQIVKLKPKRLVLVEMAEPDLYRIDKELAEIKSALSLEDIEIIPEMFTLINRDATHRVFSRWRPDTVFHAAAYKHVPLVEANVISGLGNNILGTVNATSAAIASKVQHFILISTDKAVRPTSVMGTSKRICELVLQAHAMAGGDTRFAMVRFGNVLGSSGSVIPLFKEQIAQGGPVTVTDRNVTRYFMTIPEAAQLVIQAGAMAQGGEVFLLDMGASVRIWDLARTLIHLSGLSVRDENNPEGDIELVESGLRPGEKLYEELLIEADSEPTNHPQISRAREELLDGAILSHHIDAMTAALTKGDADTALAIMVELVPEYMGDRVKPQLHEAS